MDYTDFFSPMEIDGSDYSYIMIFMQYLWILISMIKDLFGGISLGKKDDDPSAEA